MTDDEQRIAWEWANGQWLGDGWQYYLQRALEALAAPSEPSEQQIKRLADFIMENIPGEPSRSEGAVDTAIRLLRAVRSEVLARTRAHVFMSQAMTRYADNPTSDNRGELLAAVHRWGDTLARASAPAARSGEPEAPSAELWEALVKAGMPLEVIVADEDRNGRWRDLSPTLREMIYEAVKAVRWALAARPRGEPKPELPPLAYGDMVSQGVSPHPANEPPPEGGKP